MTYTLPKSVVLGGTEYAIRWDYRPILDICTAQSDVDLSDQEKAFVALTIFYPDFDSIPEELYQEAIDKCMWFLNGGDEVKAKPGPKLVDWEQDFNLIVNPVNRVLGREIREETPTHWFTLLSAYQEIGDCTFSQVVRIRSKKARGKQLDKQDREWYRKNRELVDFKQSYTKSQTDLLKEWSGV